MSYPEQRDGLERAEVAGLNVETDIGAGRTEIRCAGEIDVGTCATLIDAFDRTLSGSVDAVRVDLQAVTFIDSTGIGCLLHGALKAEKLGAAFLVVPSDAVQRFIDLTGLGHPLQIAR
jgi:anti-sigma B factor antagonist